MMSYTTSVTVRLKDRCTICDEPTRALLLRQTATGRTVDRVCADHGTEYENDLTSTVTWIAEHMLEGAR
jgi:hypothetical protein